MIRRRPSRALRSMAPAQAAAAVITVAMALAGCKGDLSGSPGASAAASASAKATEEAAGLAGAAAAAKRLGSTLRQRLGDAMNEGGRTNAMKVCADEAQGLVATIRSESGARVGRSSLRLRSEADRAPPWVAEWLAAQGERSAAGVTGIRAVADTPGGRVARVLKPLEVEPTCLGCHGDPAGIPAEVRAVLTERYPTDKATGYRIGDLRGALWAEVDVL